MSTSPTSIMADSNVESSMATHLMVANAKRQNLRQTLESVHSQWQVLAKYFDSISDAIAKHVEETELKSQQIEWRRKYLDKKSREIELNEKRLEERLKMADDRCKEIDATYELVGRCSGVVKQRQMYCDEECERIRCKKERLREYKNNLTRKFEREKLKLEAKELRVDNLEHELKVRKEKLGLIERTLLVRLEEVELKEKRVDERVRDLERREKMLEVKLKQRDLQVGNDVKVKIEPLGECDDGDEMLVDPSYADIKINVSMDGRALQTFLNGRVNDHEILRDEIIAGLRLSSDPAKLVLDAILGFYPDELENGDVGFDLIVVRKSCILLLEQLIKMKPRIKPRVRERALRVAIQWKGKMKIGDIDHYLDVVGFLQLVATYGLTCVFDKDELLLLFEGCTCHDQAPELCRSLGLTDDIHGVIQNLVIRDLPFDAIRLIYAFELVDIFPPAPILKAHLASMIAHAERMYNCGDPFVAAQIKCIKAKLAALVSVVKCIKEYTLDCDYPVQPLVQLISELKMLKRKYKASSPTSMAQEETDIEEHCMISTDISSSVKETTSLPFMEHAASPVTNHICSESTGLKLPPGSAIDTEPLMSSIPNDSCSTNSHGNSVSPVVASTMITPNSVGNPGHKSDVGSPSSMKVRPKSTTQKNKRPRLASACDSRSTLQPVNPHLLSLSYASRSVYMLSTTHHRHSGCYLTRYYPYR